MDVLGNIESNMQIINDYVETTNSFMKSQSESLKQISSYVDSLIKMKDDLIVQLRNNSDNKDETKKLKNAIASINGELSRIKTKISKQNEGDNSPSVLNTQINDIINKLKESDANVENPYRKNVGENEISNVSNNLNNDFGFYDSNTGNETKGGYTYKSSPRKIMSSRRRSVRRRSTKRGGSKHKKLKH